MTQRTVVTCSTCKWAQRGWLTGRVGKLALCKHPKSDRFKGRYAIVTGRPGHDYQFCAILRQCDDLCGKGGKWYEALHEDGS